MILNITESVKHFADVDRVRMLSCFSCYASLINIQSRFCTSRSSEDDNFILGCKSVADMQARE